MARAGLQLRRIPGTRRYDARVNESLARAFPARLAPPVTSVMQLLPAARFGPSKPVTVSYSRAWAGLVVAGEPVVIPYRVYNPVLPPHLASGLSRTERDVPAAIYSRHHDGHVRQRALRAAGLRRAVDRSVRRAAPRRVRHPDLRRHREIHADGTLRRAGHAGELVGLPQAEPLLRRANQAACDQLLVLLPPDPARLAGYLSSAHSAQKAQRQLGSLNTKGKPASERPPEGMAIRIAGVESQGRPSSSRAACISYRRRAPAKERCPQRTSSAEGGLSHHQ